MRKKHVSLLAAVAKAKAKAKATDDAHKCIESTNKKQLESILILWHFG